MSDMKDQAAGFQWFRWDVNEVALKVAAKRDRNSEITEWQCFWADFR